MDATAFCSNHVWKRWFWPQKLSMNAPRFESAFWNAVYSKSAFWNAVYSKISMDATAFCSNHVWKRWFWPQKLSINAPLVCWGCVCIYSLARMFFFCCCKNALIFFVCWPLCSKNFKNFKVFFSTCSRSWRKWDLTWPLSFNHEHIPNKYGIKIIRRS